jgi:ActR/RegA family two-component response regulator
LGIDILFIDCERAGIGIDMVGPMARAAQRHGAAAVVRSKTRQVEDWVSYLDRGIDGLIVPRVETAQEARLILETVSYACGSRAADMIIIPQIESEAGLRNIDEILAALDEDTDHDEHDPEFQEPMSVRRLEWEHIQKVLLENDGNISETARQLKMHRRTLQRKLQKKPVAG